jgi:hypothetical protein
MGVGSRTRGHWGGGAGICPVGFLEKKLKVIKEGNIATINTKN